LPPPIEKANCPMLDSHICERARLARDARFDGLFFTGVLTTGIYCRPVCPAPEPKRENVVYFPSAAAAAQAGLRPCLRCRPEAAPGTPAWNGTCTTVARAMNLIRQGAFNEGDTEALASRLGVGGRHLRRLFKQHLGASPIAIANTQRVFFANQLLRETTLPVSDIAYTCGFGSIRRFNAAFRKAYAQSPTGFRRRHTDGSGDSLPGFQCRLTLAYRPPYDWDRMLAFFRHRAIPGVERVDRKGYHRVIRHQQRLGAIHVFHAPARHALLLEVQLARSPGLMEIVQRVRRMFDLDANMDAVHRTLAADGFMAPMLQGLEGLRLPGSWDPFETAVRAVVGQQVSVKGARTVVGRIAQKAGTAAEGFTDSGLTRCFPTADALGQTDLTGIGIPAKRIETLKTLSRGVASGAVVLEIGSGLAEFVRRLIQVPGIGTWTAHYIALRGLGEPDAFPESDLGIVRALTRDGEKPTPGKIRQMAEPWRPWRGYAATVLWNS
jgi:AraC family transcriptional regulator of adaptative response / DNA-3-methyladenine glycosylase II